MFARIALLLGVLCVPVLLALASQGLAESTDPPQMPEPATTAVASVPASLGGASTGTPQVVQVEPQPVGAPADLDGDRDDDGIPDERDDSDAEDTTSTDTTSKGTTSKGTTSRDPAAAPSVAEVDR